MVFQVSELVSRCQWARTKCNRHRHLLLQHSDCLSSVNGNSALEIFLSACLHYLLLCVIWLARLTSRQTADLLSFMWVRNLRYCSVIMLPISSRSFAISIANKRRSSSSCFWLQCKTYSWLVFVSITRCHTVSYRCLISASLSSETFTSFCIWADRIEFMSLSSYCQSPLLKWRFEHSFLLDEMILSQASILVFQTSISSAVFWTWFGS